MTDAVRISCVRVKKLTKAQRLHNFMARIYEKQKVTVDEPAQEFHVSYRTMLRYLQELSGMGVLDTAEDDAKSFYNSDPCKKK